MTGRRRALKAAALAVKLGFLALTGFLLVRMVDWREFWGGLRLFSPWLFGVVVLINLVSALIMARRWDLLIRAAGLRVPFGTVAAYTFLGMFFNQILPGSVSGDAARIWCLGGRHTTWKKSAGIILWDRVLGLVALIAITLVIMPRYWRVALDGRAAIMLWLLFLAGFAVFLSLQSGAVIGGLEALVRRLRRSPPDEEHDWAAALFSGIRSFLTDRAAMAWAFLLSLVIRAFWIAGAWIISEALGLPVPWGYYLFAISLVELLRSVPVSVQGLGVRELALVYFLAPYGVTAAQATLLSLLFYTALTAAGLAAGLVYLVQKLAGGIRYE